MAWFNSGNWGGLHNQNLKTIYVELATAINEREAMMGSIAETKWANVGADKARPAESDYNGFGWFENSGAKAVSILDGMQARIGSMLAR